MSAMDPRQAFESPFRSTGAPRFILSTLHSHRTEFGQADTCGTKLRRHCKQQGKTPCHFRAEKRPLLPSSHQKGLDFLVPRVIAVRCLVQSANASMGVCGSKPKAAESPIRIAKDQPLQSADSKKKDQKPIERPTRKLRTDAKVRDVYKLGRTLGTGGFAVVKLGTDKNTGEEFAIKIMALPEVGRQTGDNENTREDIFKEIDILVGMEHENVIFMKEYFEENNKVYLVTELLLGGELLDAVLDRGSYSEADARLCFSQLLSGIDYLHGRGVVHRDLKLENLLLATPQDITRVKIADFGLAKKAAESQMETICGTPQYVAPEVIQGTPGLIYSPAVDLWSAGVVLFILLGGYPPFYDESEPALFAQIRKGSFSFDDPVWDTISDSAKDLISKLLTTDAAKRLTAAQALEHEWISNTNKCQKSTLTLTRKNLMKHHGARFKGTVNMIIAQNRLAKLAAAKQEGNGTAATAFEPPKALSQRQIDAASKKLQEIQDDVRNIQADDSR